MEGDKADGCGADLNALEQIERRAQIIGQTGAQHIAVGKNGDRLALVLCADALEGGDDPILHLAQGFAAGEAKAAGEDLHQLPLRSFAQFLQFAAAPVAVIDLQNARLDGDGEVQGGGEGLGGLETAHQRAGIDRRNGLRLETFGDLLGLFPAFLVQRDGRRSAGERAALGPLVFAVTNEEEIGRARGRLFFALLGGGGF